MRIYKVFALLGLFISIFYNCSLPADDEEDYNSGDDIGKRVVESEARRYLNCALLEEDD